ncbi:MAG: Hsp70 family protein [Pseudonocardiaceae bacterium]
MGYWLGIDVGSTFTTAAICREEPGRRALPEVVPLGNRSAAVSSVVYLGPDGQVVVGEAAERCATTTPDRVVREFARRIGDKVPMVIGGVPHSAPEVAALVLRWVLDRVAQREGGSALGITITHPVGWDAEAIQAVADALHGADLPEVTFCTAPQAAPACYSARERLHTGATIAVYDLGGSTFEAAVLRQTGTGTFSVLGVPERIERLGGVDFDDAVFGYVVAAVPALRELAATDRVQRSIALCRRECTEAKEVLSAGTEVTIPVLLPEVQAQVRLVRAEFEDLIRPQVAQTVQALRRTLRSAGVGPADLDAVLLVGGSSRVPLIAQLVSAELDRPVTVDADPQSAIALGAALSGLPADSSYSAYPAYAGTASAGVEPDTLYAPAPAMVGAHGFAGSDVSEFAPTGSPPTEVPHQQSPTAIPWHVTNIDVDVPQRRRATSRRFPQFAAAGGLVLVGGVAAVLFVTSHSSPSTPTTARTPAPVITTPAPVITTPAPVITTPTPNPGSDSSPRSPELPGPIPTTPADAPQQPTGDTAEPAAAPVLAPHNTRAPTRSRTTNRSTPPAAATPPAPSGPPLPTWVTPLRSEP